jgi:hypothetical protein
MLYIRPYSREFGYLSKQLAIVYEIRSKRRNNFQVPNNIVESPTIFLANNTIRNSVSNIIRNSVSNSVKIYPTT